MARTTKYSYLTTTQRSGGEYLFQNVQNRRIILIALKGDFTSFVLVTITIFSGANPTRVARR